jgi:hypothetical protein
MRQATLDEYVKIKCRVCGRTFKTWKALNIHQTKTHPDMEPPVKYADEDIEVIDRGSHVEMRIIMRRTLWKDIERRMKEAKTTIDDLVFDTLVNIAAFGDEWASMMKNTAREPTYIS